MSTNVKALIVVLAIAWVVFRFGKPIALLFTNESDFSRRRNVWFVLTVVGFLSPNFWLFALVAAPLLTWAGRKDSNPVALYLLLLHVIPPVPVEIPAIAVKALFSLNNYRLLSFFVLIPAAWQLKKLNATERIRGLTPMDLSIVAFGLLQLLHYVPPDLPDGSFTQDSATNILRRGFLYFIDVYVLYFVVSRSCGTRRALIDALGTFCLAGAVMASVSVFEAFRGWLLYSGISERWGIQHIYGTQYGYYFYRAGFLRAQASTGHASALGYFLASAFGISLYLKSHVKSGLWRIAIPALLWTGLLASQARGPLLGAGGVYLAYYLLGPRALSRLLKAVSIAALFTGAVTLTPFGQRILNTVPIIGQPTDTASVDYRQRLAERSFELIQLHPFLGDPLVMKKMEDLRQGEGIIDIVNTYAGITLFYGLIGLLFFLAVNLFGLFKVYRVSREIVRRDPDYALLGASLAACLLGTFFIIGINSLVAGYTELYYALAGFTAAYAFVSKLPEPC